jgi:hypothetical protein
MRVGRLRVVHPRHTPAATAHDLDAVAVEAEFAQRLADGRGGTSSERASGRRGEDVGDDVRGAESLLDQFGDGRQLESAGAAVVQELRDPPGCRPRRPRSLGPGTPRSKPIARAPSTTSASSTMRRVAASALL